MRRLRCLTVGAGAAWEAAFVAACGDPHAGVEILGRCVELGELLARVRLDPPEAVVCDAEVDWLDADAVAEIRASGAAAVGVGPSDSARVVRLGFSVVVADDPAAIAAAAVEAGRPLDTTPRRREQQQPSQGPGVLVAVWGPKGGTGRTTVAVNLASELAMQGAECILVDADTYGGSVALALDVSERPNVATLARAIGTGDETAAANLDTLACPMPRLRVVPGLARAEAWPDLRGGDLGRLLGALRSQAQVVVVDTAACLEDDEELVLSASPWRRNQAARAVLGCVDRIYAVVSCDPASVRHAVLQQGELADAAGTAAETVHTIVNRVASQRSARQVADELADRCGWVSAASLADDTAALDALWAGRTLAEVAPRSRLRRAVAGLAADLGADWAAGRLEPRRGPSESSDCAHEVPA